MQTRVQSFDTRADGRHELVTKDLNFDPIELKAKNHISELNIAWQTATEIIAKAGECKDEDNTFDMMLSSTVTMDGNTSGAGGILDALITADTVYAVHLLEDSNGSNPSKICGSPLFSAISKPTGYDKSRRIGAFATDGSANIIKFNSLGAGRTRLYKYDTEKADLKALAAGTATTYTDISLTKYMPPTSMLVDLLLHFDSAHADDRVDVRPNGSTVSAPVTFVSPAFVSGGPRAAAWGMLIYTGDQIVEYQIVKGGAGSPSLDVYVMGFTDCV